MKCILSRAVLVLSVKIMQLIWVGLEVVEFPHIHIAFEVNELVSVGPDASGWSPIDAALLRATDELYRDDTISDATWAMLAESYGEHELIDIVITVAGYRMGSMVLNTLGVQSEPDTETVPDVERR